MSQFASILKSVRAKALAKAKRRAKKRNPETNLQNAALAAVGIRSDVLIWRQQSGVFRSMTDPSRIVRVGTVGMSDALAVVEVEVTPEMVGKRVAVFTSCETKTATGGIREEQRNWQRFVNEAGGVAVIVRSLEDAENKLSEAIDKLLQGADDR